MLSIDDLELDYGDAREEALRCRCHCALFDFSFVYRMRVSGSQVIDTIEAFQPRRVHDMSVGQIRYSVKTDEAGRVRSDLTLWRFDKHCFEIMSGCEADVIELRNLASDSFSVEDLSEDTAILSVQGPDTLNCLDQLTDISDLRRLGYFRFSTIEIDNIPILVGRLGYSGEAGFEFLLEQSSRDRTWAMLSRLIEPAGSVAMDILRIEAGFFLFTNECRVFPSIRELELPPWFSGVTDTGDRRLVAFTATARSDLKLAPWQPNRSFERQITAGEIHITSACFSPQFDSVLGLGFVSRDQGDTSPVDPMNEFFDIKLCPLPPWDPGKRRPREAW